MLIKDFKTDVEIQNIFWFNPFVPDDSIVRYMMKILTVTQAGVKLKKSKARLKLNKIGKSSLIAKKENNIILRNVKWFNIQ